MHSPCIMNRLNWRENGFTDLGTQYPLKENISGAVISDEPIDFHGENQMSMKGIQFLDDEPLVSLERLLEQKSDGPVAAETADFCMVQG